MCKSNGDVLGNFFNGVVLNEEVIACMYVCVYVCVCMYSLARSLRESREIGFGSLQIFVLFIASKLVKGGLNIRILDDNL